jgi:hypothetical protein
VCTVLPTDVPPGQQAHESLIDEGRCLKDVSWTLASQVPTSELAKLRFDEWDELVERRTVSCSPRDEQLGYLRGRSRRRGL